MALPILILGGVAWTIWYLCRKEVDLRILVCRSHGGDAVERCPACGRMFCMECLPEGHCEKQWTSRDSWASHA